MADGIRRRGVQTKDTETFGMRGAPVPANAGEARRIRRENETFECGRPTCNSNQVSCIINERRTAGFAANECTNHNHFRMDKPRFSRVIIFNGITGILPEVWPSPRCRYDEKATKSKFRRKSRMSTQLFLTLCLLPCLLAEAKNSMKGGPPRLLGDAKTKVTATVGQTLTLPCMVAADSIPLTSWEVNGEHILVGRPRFKQNLSNLRIRDVRTSDEGVYRCTATNGFGSAQVEIKLIVEAALSERSTPTKPRFVLSAKMRRRNLVKPAGSFLRLRCRASGYPTPEIEWYKDGNLTSPKTASSGKKRRPMWMYTVRKLTLNDSGYYNCRVWNSVGEISYSYKVKVVDELRERPILLEPHPMNTTVRVGGMTTIQCRVQSVAKPTIKWIKRLTERALLAYGDERPTNIITIEGKHYLILPTQKMLTLPDGSYLNKLVIRRATEQHAGMYICLGANTMGYNYRYAYLTVLPDPAISPLQNTASPPHHAQVPLRPPSKRKQSSMPLPVIIGVPSGIGFLMAIVFTWYCQRRRDQKLKGGSTKVVVSGSDRMSAVGSMDTKSSTRSSPIPNDTEHQGDFDNNNKECPQAPVANPDRYLDRTQDGIYSHRHRTPPTVGTPLLTVTEPDDTYFQIDVLSDDDPGVPIAPPPSEAATIHAPSYYSSSHYTSDKRGFRSLPPSPPPPSQYSASSVSSYPDNMPQYPPHYHYHHPRRYHHHHHHSRGDHPYGC